MMKNQQGYALLLVLGAVVIIGLLVPPLAYQIISSSSQATQTEQTVQLDNMYDMGKQMGRRHVEAAVNGEMAYGGFEEIVEKANGEVTWEHVENHFKNELYAENGNVPLKINNLDFQTYQGEVEVTFTEVKEASDRLQIEYMVTPAINEESSESVTETFYLGREGGDGSEWLNDDGSIDEGMFGDEDPNTYTGNGNHAGGNNLEEDFINGIFMNGGLTLTNENYLNGPVAFGDGVELKTTTNEGETIINGNIYSSGSIFEVYRQSSVIIHGNAHFHHTNFIIKHSQNTDESFIFIDGDVYDYGGNTFEGTQTENFVKVENIEEVENFDVKREVYYTGDLISVIPSYMTGLILEGTRGEY